MYSYCYCGPSPAPATTIRTQSRSPHSITQEYYISSTRMPSVCISCDATYLPLPVLGTVLPILRNVYSTGSLATLILPTAAAGEGSWTFHFFRLESGSGRHPYAAGTHDSRKSDTTTANYDVRECTYLVGTDTNTGAGGAKKLSGRWGWEEEVGWRRGRGGSLNTFVIAPGTYPQKGRSKESLVCVSRDVHCFLFQGDGVVGTRK